MFEKGSVLENVQITGFSSEGKTVARVDNIVLFVENAVPGDLVDVQIYRTKKKYAEGRAIRVIEPSVKRTEPFCQHFGTCGGCKWQHLSYQSQLEFKQQQVVDAFERIGKLELPEVLPIIGSEKIKY